MAQEYLGQLGDNDFDYNAPNNQFNARSEFRLSEINTSLEAGSEFGYESPKPPYGPR